MPAGSVATGFSMNTCLPALDRVLEMLRPIAGRLGEQHDIDAAVDRFAIGVEADELPFLGDVDQISRVRALISSSFEITLYVSEARIDPVRERVAKRPKFHRTLGLERLHDGARAAIAASDERNLERVVARGVHGRCHRAREP